MSFDQTEQSEVPERGVVVGIGASAGGLRPLQELFGKLPTNTGMTFIVVQHLSPNFDSVMDELLARHTTMDIHVIQQDMELQRDTIYLNPAGQEVSVTQGKFVLTPFDTSELRMPINVLFRSLAEEYGPDAVGIVLSGTGSDGSLGIQAIQRMSGLTIAQTLSTAQFDGMPENAIATGAVDYTLSPAAIAHLVGEHAIAPAVRPTGADLEMDLSDGNAVQIIFSLLSQAYGIDFAHYKPTTVSRRIDRRLQLAGYAGLREYVDALQDDEDELSKLYHDLLIGVTCFFRDREAFRTLRAELESLIGNRGEKETIRVWCAGCATGEEAYSLAIMINDIFVAQKAEPRFKVFATDVHDRSLDYAAKGVYHQETLEALSSEQRSNYFEQIGDEEYKVRPKLRNCLVFAKQNVVNDPPFTNVDLVTCRNLLIYLLDDAQLSAISGFRFALKPNGLMMLGPSETLGRLSDGFDVIHKGWRLFRKNSRVRMAVDTRAAITRQSMQLQGSPTFKLIKEQSGIKPRSNVADSILRGLLDLAVLIDANNNILHVYGDLSAFLPKECQVVGSSLMDAFDGAAQTAIFALTSQACRSIGETCAAHDIQIQASPTGETITLRAKAFATGYYDPVVLIQFPEQDDEAKSALGETDEALTEELRRELAGTRETLGTSIQELESSNEEMQSTNEEMVASNEELQATNEELQSVNEELHTVNIEHQRKVQELQEVTDDFNNLFNNTSIGLILLDKDMHIRKFTQDATRYFNLLQHDIGRPLSNFAPKLHIDKFFDHLREVLQTEVSCHWSLQDKEEQLISVEVSPFQKGEITSGVIISIINITAIQKRGNEVPRRRSESDSFDSRDSIEN